MLEHERVSIAVGERSALPVIVAVHSTALGQAVGGCRLWRYRDWREALEDALRLSEAMTLKCALAGLPLGGGKSVIALASGLRAHGSSDGARRCSTSATPSTRSAEATAWARTWARRPRTC